MGRSISHLADTHAYQYAPACDFDQKIDKLLTCLRPKTLSTKHLTLEAGMSFTFTLVSRVKSPRKDLKRVFTPIKNGMTRDQYLFHLWIPPNLSSLFSHYLLHCISQSVGAGFLVGSLSHNLRLLHAIHLHYTTLYPMLYIHSPFYINNDHVCDVCIHIQRKESFGGVFHI